MRRVYTSTAHFRQPYKSSNISFAGLGVLGASDHRAYDANKWPTKRSYFDVSQYRMPYRSGFYQDGNLRGLGADAQAQMTGGQKFALVAMIVGGIAFGVLGDKMKKARR